MRGALVWSEMLVLLAVVSEMMWRHRVVGSEATKCCAAGVWEAHKLGSEGYIVQPGIHPQSCMGLMGNDQAA